MKRVICLYAAAIMMGAVYGADREVSVYNATDGVTLQGTLSAPADGMPRAAVVMATGSGVQNRDEEVAGHRPFAAIARSLTDAGYAVLRMDDRGWGLPPEAQTEIAGWTDADLTRDIEAGVAYVDSVYGGRVPTGIIGHSSGGQMAVRVAASNPRCRFIVTLAAPAWRGDSLVMAQSRALATAMTGRWDGEHLQRRIIGIASGTLPDAMARMSVYTVLAEAFGEAASLPQVGAQISQQADAVVSPWYRAMLRYDPADDISRVGVPWLALNGDRDLQVPHGSLDTIKRLNPGADTRVMAGLNHLFLPSATGLPSEYGELPGDIDASVTASVVEWLGEMLQRSKF